MVTQGEYICSDKSLTDERDIVVPLNLQPFRRN